MSSSNTATSSVTYLCEHCRQPAWLKCAACPATNPTWYCSKACQKANWKTKGKHFSLCEVKNIYAEFRTLSWLADASKIPDIPWPDLQGFLRQIPVEARAIKFSGDDKIAGIHAAECVKGIYALRKTTKAAHIARIATLEEKYKYTPAHLVPFTDRPWEHDFEDGLPIEGIQLYPQDYKLLSACTASTGAKATRAFSIQSCSASPL